MSALCFQLFLWQEFCPAVAQCFVQVFCVVNLYFPRSVNSLHTSGAVQHSQNSPRQQLSEQEMDFGEHLLCVNMRLLWELSLLLSVDLQSGDSHGPLLELVQVPLDLQV